jgi:hypothetical protein
MKLKQHVEKRIVKMDQEIMHGESRGRGNLPGVVMAHLKHKKRVLEEILKLLKMNDINL